MVTAASDLLKESEAAQVLGVTAGTLAVWRSTGRYSVPFIKLGRLVHYKPSDLQDFLERRRVTSTGQLASAGV